MRDHEFRAWDKKHKVMIYHFVLSGNFKERSKRYVVMGFTGVRDSTGRKIFEGDFLQWSYRDGYAFSAKVIFTDYMQKGDLDSDKRFIGFMLEFSDGGVTDFPIEIPIEVVSNLFETNAQQSISAK